jgi:hypothetical protein
MTSNRRHALKVFAASCATLLTLSTASMADSGDPSREGGLGDGAWAVLAGSTLKSTLEGWARITEPQWEVIWDNPTDYRIRASATFYGTFEDAVGRLVDAVHQSNPELSVTLYRGNKVIHVETLTISNE